MRVRTIFDFSRDTRATAAVEMALVAPLLLVIMMGSAELGNYFMNEHSLLKAVRDGSRFAARQSFTWYPNCSGDPDADNVVTPTKNIVMYGYLAGSAAGSGRLTPNISASDISVTTQCFTGQVGGQTMTGIYDDRTNGAQIVTVSATVNYRSILATAFGFSGLNKKLNATSQAAVTGI